MIRMFARKRWSDAKRSHAGVSGERRVGIERALSRNEKMTTYLEEDQETLLLGFVLGKLAAGLVESGPFS
jgi:hypothetical protein